MLRIVVMVAFFAAVALAAQKYVERNGASAEFASAEVSQSGARARPRDGFRVALRADSSGHYYSKAVINGRSLDVIIDTGATSVALTEETARRLSIVPPKSAFRVPIATANGQIDVAPVTIDEIQIGGVRVRNVAAIVVPGNALSVNLLGMTFLNKLRKFESSGGQLILVQ